MTTPSPAPTSLMANAIRALSMDAVQKANSGHPGMPMGMAEIGVALWSRHLRHNPKNPQWADRDRFVLSNGHGSMLLYSLLHLTGYDLPIEELKNFREFLSRADADRLNRENDPGRTPEVLEKYSAYAIALNVEHAWGEEFTGNLLEILQFDRAYDVPLPNPPVPGADDEIIQLNIDPRK